MVHVGHRLERVLGHPVEMPGADPPIGGDQLGDAFGLGECRPQLRLQGAAHPGKACGDVGQLLALLTAHVQVPERDGQAYAHQGEADRQQAVHSAPQRAFAGRRLVRGYVESLHWAEIGGD